MIDKFAMPTSTSRLIVSLILRRDDKILILNEPDDAGKMRLNLPGGHVELGENILEAGRREALEETGLKISIGPLIQVVTSLRNDGTHSVRQTFYGHIEGGELKTEEGSSAIWMSGSEVELTPEDAFVFGVKDALLLAFDQQSIDMKHVVIRSKGEGISWDSV